MRIPFFILALAASALAGDPSQELTFERRTIDLAVTDAGAVA